MNLIVQVDPDKESSVLSMLEDCNIKVLNHLDMLNIPINDGNAPIHLLALISGIDGVLSVKLEEEVFAL